jgi:RimJ/RimL family protein N-acetyltransferase
MHQVWQAEPAEWQVYREVRLTSLADEPAAFGSTLDEELQLSAQDWRNRLTNAAVFLGKRNGEVAGTATGLPTAEDQAEMVGVWVCPAARGTGLAAELIQAVLAWGKDRNKISVHLVEGNLAAEKLYTRLGFERTGHRIRLPRDPSIIEIQLVRTA